MTHQMVDHLAKRDKEPEVNKGLLSVDHLPCWMLGFVPVYPNDRLNPEKLRIKALPNIFQNYDRMHQLTMSYRESEREVWLADLSTILSGFQITNDRSPDAPDSGLTSSGSGEILILTIVVSAILTWGIGLAPPLLMRFVILRRAVSRGTAFLLVAGFWFLNLMLFIALGSQSKTHGALFLVALPSYHVLRVGPKKTYSELQSPDIQRD